MNEKIVPSDIKIMFLKPSVDKPTKSNIKIISFRHNDIKYIENDEYDYCLDILIKFGLESFIYDNIKKVSLLNIIEKKYFTSNLESFIPNQNSLFL